MKFTNKTILIISPNSWGKMKVSKHHYAIELAARGNRVFFLNPPNLKNKYFEAIEIDKNLYIINYKPFFRGERFLPEFIFDILVKWQIHFLQKKIGLPIDILWSFSSNIYFNLKAFKTKLRIFFPVDRLEGYKAQAIAKNADYIFSISDVILKQMQPYKDKCFFINHGLSNIYAQSACLRGLGKYKKEGKINCCFIGNILIKSLDRKIFKQLIIQNSDVHFSLYGAYEINDSNLNGYNDSSVLEFVEFLKTRTNVSLKGSCEPKDIVSEIFNFDIFLLLINPQNDYNEGSNSHKILEYLSTGKVVVSNYVSTYESFDDIIEMVEERHNKKLPHLFKKVISDLNFYNSPLLQTKRREFALSNTYAKQIEKIENRINQEIS